jgi:hypothetical protein
MQGLPLDRLTRYCLFFSLFLHEYGLYGLYGVQRSTYIVCIRQDIQQSGVAKSDQLHIHFLFR